MSAAPTTFLNLLLFSVGGVSFGVEADQTESIAACTDGTGDAPLLFHELLDYGDVSISYASPTIISVKAGKLRTYRVIIDSMEDISEFNQNDIRPFPPLLEPFALRKGMWGILIRDNRLVLLMDFRRLLRDKPDTAYNLSEVTDQ